MSANKLQRPMEEQFQVEQFGDVYIGDFALTQQPIRFGAIQPCVIPPGGGLCEYGIRVSYRGTGSRYRGEVWSTVGFYGPPNYRSTRFQVGKWGLKNPNPQSLDLRQGQTETLTFQLDVLANIPDNSTICGSISVGSLPEAQFNSQGDHLIFCSNTQSGALTPMSEKEGREFIRDKENKSQVLSNQRGQRGINQDKRAAFR